MPPEALSDQLQTLTGNPWDLVRRPLFLNEHWLEIIYLRGLVKEERIDQVVIRPLQNFLATLGSASDLDLFSTNDFLPSFITATETRILQDMEQAVDLLLEGWVLLVSTESKLIPALYLPGWAKRLPSEPASEKTLRGPREGFTEDLLENVTLIRRWIKNPGLRVEEKTIGTRTKTRIVLAFLADLASPELIKEVHKRLDAIEIDAVLESAYLEELITDERLTIFPLIQATERSDKVTAALFLGLTILLAFQNWHLLNILPIGGEPVGTYLNGGIQSLYIFYPLTLIFQATAFSDHREKVFPLSLGPQFNLRPLFPKLHRHRRDPHSRGNHPLSLAEHGICPYYRSALLFI